ncbi:MAG: helix-turn-helix domain-containing protein [Pseudomonadota bacterium]
MARHPAFDRDEIIDRARDLFWRQGWAGTSMKDLGDVLGLKPGSFYGAFESKEGLFLLALDRYAADGAARLAELEVSLEPLEVLIDHLRQVVLATDRPARACMLSKTLLETEGALKARADAHLSEMEARFATLFRKAQSAADIHRAHDPAHLARRYQADLIGLRAMAERPGTDAATLVADSVAGLRALSEPPRADRVAET